jgi:hypothetical protein
MLGIVGTIPDPHFPLTHGKVRLSNGCIGIQNTSLPITRGTPALLGAAAKAAECNGGPEVYAFLVGDIGRGAGSRRLYQFLERHLAQFDFQALAFHYVQPDVRGHNAVLNAIAAMRKKPILIADAGYMYVAKMSGHAPSYDFFTPDIGELAFLADELAPHPFYTRGFILHQNESVPALIERACRHRNAARHLLVKGRVDTIVQEGRIVRTVESPSFEAMEAIGGTGDTLTGILAVLCALGLPPVEAAVRAAEANRWTGAMDTLSPATPVAELIERIPAALSRVGVPSPGADQ